MSRIEKLLVSGVRSFGFDEPQHIQFNTPLTLIVGYNGSGKTTIIECLKYATTGELPPNSKGGAFIHDPNLTGEREVLAQVKLKFRTPPNADHVVSRRIQLTVKKTTRSQKTLESTMVTNRDGERTVVSSKNAQIDMMVPKTLNVAPAVLDAVIFCHQDESLWPMSEPSALKKRFDEIFEAQKYIKAIENLKVIRKKHGELLNKFKLLETTEKQNKDRADECETRGVEMQAEIEELRVEIQEMAARIAVLDENVRSKREQAKSFDSIVQDLKTKRSHLGFRQTTVQDLKASIKELSEPDEWLEENLAQFEEKVARHETELEENKGQYTELQKELTQSRRLLGTKQSERGKHQSDKDKYERQLELRVELVQHAASLHGIRGYDGQLSDKQAQQFSERIQKILNDKKRELEYLQKENREEADKKQAVITECEGRKAGYIRDRTFAKQRIGNVEKRVGALQAQLNVLDVDEGRKAVLDAELNDVEQRLQRLNEDFQNAEFDNKIRHESNELAKLEAENDRLGRDMVECTRLADDRAQLGLRKKQLAEKRRNLDTITSTWGDKISSMIALSWKPESIEQEFHRAQKDRAKVLEEATRKRDEQDQHLKQTQFSLRSLEEKAKSQGDQLEKCKTTVCKALTEVNPDDTPNVDNLPSEIEELEESVLTLEKDVSLFDSLKEFYDRCQKAMNKKNRCLLCERAFGPSPGEKAKLIEQIQNGLNEKGKEKTKDELTLAEQQLGSLRMVRSQYDTYVRLSSEKPGLRQEIQALKEKEESILRKLEELDQAVREKQEECQDLDSMSKTVSAIARFHQDITEAESQVERIVSQQQASGATRTPEEIRELQETCSEQMRTVKTKLTALQTERQRIRDSISSLELDRSGLVNKVNDAARQLERREDLQNQIQSHKDDLNHQKEIIHQADKDLEKVEPEIAKARAIRNDVMERGHEKESKVASERDGLAGSVNELKLVENDIQDYVGRGGPSLLATTDREIHSLQKSEARIEKDMQELAATTNKLREEINNSDRQKQNIRDNLNYRKSLREVGTLKSEIAELEARNATEDYERLSEEASDMERERHKVNAEQSAKIGAMTMKDNELVRLMQKWETEYQHAAKNYRQARVKVETTKAAIEDLGLYGQALDSAIMRYHSLKMDDVNRIAGDLWKRTYQGTDIDTILIRSDNESTTGRRSYNYRVCMVKQDTEMDMRGRCSAGQKVLASIIIRLALAETFGANCGLIALDEPTTNLDSDNIRALAESLHNLINDRRSQSNFQLIIITHDEEFLRHMRCSDFCDFFYRVGRDEHQNSTIKRESIRSVI
ncbi:Recombination/repair protein Rad50 [Apiospora rasikravindrae]|uniref:Recombination/repair protein Rad50 n=1 Tax=Apiospora rasikravindrae TaxID=990691 RepID=A0ABR1RN52_9PEZI